MSENAVLRAEFNDADRRFLAWPALQLTGLSAAAFLHRFDLRRSCNSAIESKVRAGSGNSMSQRPKPAGFRIVIGHGSETGNVVPDKDPDPPCAGIKDRTDGEAHLLFSPQDLQNQILAAALADLLL